MEHDQPSTRDARYQALLIEADAAMRANDIARATRAAQIAVNEGFEHPALLNICAYRLSQQGHPDQALEYLERARALTPHDIHILNALGICLGDLGRHRDAIAIYDTALALAPDAAEIHYNKALTHEILGELDAARRHYARAIALQPMHAGALGQFAMLAIHRGGWLRVRDYAMRALRVDPHQPAAILALAHADCAARDFTAARQRLSPLFDDPSVSPVNRSIAHGLLGDVLDELGVPAAAFESYRTSKAILRAHFAPKFAAPGTDSALVRVRRLIAYFSHASAAQWAPPPSAKTVSRGGPKQVFLVGFPRSGTTLLEQILASHPAVETMEEKDCLIDAAADFLLSPAGLPRLAAIGENDITRYRDAYWDRAAQAGAKRGGAVFIDKMPLNTILLCLVAKLFPQAKILFVLRDPRDVVLSCFRRRFGMNAQMYELTTLEGAAEYYDAVMTLAALYREKLALDIYEVRYENLIADLEAVAHGVCAFLGLKWVEAMRTFAVRARARNIGTPSGAQVAQGLYRRGVGQWRNYRAELKPVLPRLKPWIERFGYPAA